MVDPRKNKSVPMERDTFKKVRPMSEPVRRVCTEIGWIATHRRQGAGTAFTNLASFHARQS